MTAEASDESGGLRITGRAVHDRGLLRVTTTVANAADQPLEDIRVKVAVDSAEFKVESGGRMQVHHLLPGDETEHVFVLQPRRTVEPTPLMIRGRARKGEDDVRCELDLGEISYKVGGFRREGDDEGIPRM